jgi:hypothetical protein
MSFILKDETANVDVLYIDYSGQVGIMGSANSGQALTFAGVGVISTGATFASGVGQAGSPSSLEGTVVIPAGVNTSINYSYPQPPSVSSDLAPIAVTTTATTFYSAGSRTVSYNIW